MTIHHHALNARLSNLERCAEEAPEGTFEQARNVTVFVGEMSNHALEFARRLGLPAGNDDRLRNLECALLDYIISSAAGSTPDHAFLDDMAASEGFGQAMDGPAAAQVKAGIERDRDELRALGAV